MRGALVGRKGLLLLVVAMLMTGLAMLAIAGCGGDDGKGAGNVTTTASSSSSGGSGEAAGGDGVALAEEILAAFDEVVAKAADLAKGQPEPAELKSKLEELYESFRPRMTELNAKYSALKEADSKEFGNCNSYLGDNRGKHVTAKDDTLTEAIKYYNLELGDQEIVGLLSSGPVELLDLAVGQN